MKTLTSLLAALLLVLGLFSPESSAQDWDPTDKDQVFFTLQSRIMDIDHGKNQLVVAERDIELISLKEGGQELNTILADAKGGKIDWKSLQRGDLVFVRGFEQSGGPILAREIYRLSTDTKGTGYSFQGNIPDWKWTPAKQP